ncbi:PREDICTED: uncharacterized protein LOC108803457 [Nanorana parkeri]|uniref:uncharacterized protein LOC108803457 n=1 Tax=Nanorana parkeri TaxID=125878 RepID=UPI0008548713|nr:PREDICTED: uncharacterized protein LOC108803457 [Nanorana parkeri]
MRMIFLHTAAILWILCGVSAQYVNVALQGRATQSSVYQDYTQGFLTAAINAIDGNPDSNFFHGSCSHTHNDPSPWWRVDLLKPYKITYITITNRGDCCGERLNGAEILVGNSLTNNGNNNARCGVVTSIPNGGTQHFPCHGLVGQYVNVVLPGKSQFLHLCEVQWCPAKSNSFTSCLAKIGTHRMLLHHLDWDENRNVALQGRATQSAIYRSEHYGYQSAAINAIDGNRDPIFAHGSCSHTHNDPSPWWRVDLLRPYKIEYITITNRGGCCAERLNGAEILVGDSLADNGNNNQRCGVVTSIPLGGSMRFSCRGLVGRYVNIILRGKTQYLHVCEVEVWTKQSCASEI